MASLKLPALVASVRAAAVCVKIEVLQNHWTAECRNMQKARWTSRNPNQETKFYDINDNDVEEG
jgi:hypothetical protein